MPLKLSLATTSRATRRERGGAVMELAVILPLLLVTTIGLIDFGRAAYEAIEVENAAIAGASYGARTKGSADDKQGIKDAAFADLGDDVDVSNVHVKSDSYCECASGASIKCDDLCAGVPPSMYVRVRVDRKFKTLLKYPGLTDKIDLTREVHLRVQ